MASQPTLIFVPGAWHKASTWNKVANLLEAQQYKCILVTLPSTTGNPSTTSQDDIDAVRRAIVSETKIGHDVVVVVHSYGGAVGASAIKDLTRPKDTTSTSSGYVIGMAYVASGFKPTGVGFLEALGGSPPPFWKLDPSGFAPLLVDTRELFYHDLPEEEAKYWVGQLAKQAQLVFESGEGSYAGWKDTPIWYLSTLEDKALPLEVQKMLVGYARDGGADVVVREVSSSHSPMLSKPEETVEFIKEAVKAFVG